MAEISFGASKVTVAVLNYNGLTTLPACLTSISELNSPPGEVIMVDDGSTDGSLEWVREHYPKVRLIPTEFNTKLLNRLRNQALKEARLELVLLVDNDVILKADCLDKLLWGLNHLPQAAVCMPRALYEHEPTLIYQDGQILHYVGATRALNRKVLAQGTPDQPRLSIGWGVQLINKQKACEMGNFNENYVMGWGDDGEFNHKLNLAGHFCYHIPSAIVYHKRVTGARRYYGTVRNRWRFLLECYEVKTLVLCLPALAAYESSLILFLLFKGALGDYLKAIKYVISDLGSILTTRREIQAKRKLKDSQLMTSGLIFIDAEYIDKKFLQWGYGLLTQFLNGYWSLVQKLV